MVKKSPFLMRIKASFTALVMSHLCLLVACLLMLSNDVALSALQEADKSLLSRAPYIQNTTERSVDILWVTREPVPVAVDYKARISHQDVVSFDDAQTIELSDWKTNRIASLVGLKPSTDYNYRIRSGEKVLFEGVFQTNKKAGDDYSFLVWGDSGTGSDNQKKLASQINKTSADFITHTGDLIYPYGEAEKYDPYFFSVYTEILSRIPFYGSLGDHDRHTHGAKPWFDAFILPENGPEKLYPERNYYFDYADARIAIIDSKYSAKVLKETVGPWLVEIMEESDAKWKFTVMHHPPYTTNRYHDNRDIQRAKALIPFFEQAGIDISFSGHDHHYERFHPINNVTYVVTGAGGAGLYQKRVKVDPITASFDNENFSFTQIRIFQRGSESTLEGKQITDSGEVLDSWTISKP